MDGPDCHLFYCFMKSTSTSIGYLQITVLLSQVYLFSFLVQTSDHSDPTINLPSNWFGGWGWGGKKEGGRVRRMRVGLFFRNGASTLNLMYAPARTVFPDIFWFRSLIRTHGQMHHRKRHSVEKSYLIYAHWPLCWKH